MRGPAGASGRPRPGAVAGSRITAIAVSPGQVRLAWTPSADADFDAYSVFVGDHADFVPGNGERADVREDGHVSRLGIQARLNALLQGRRLQQTRPGLYSGYGSCRSSAAGYRYRGTRIDDATLRRRPATSDLARGSLGLLPAPLGPGGPRPKATWQFSVPHEGVYYVWARYATLDAKRVSQFWIDCDGDNQLQGADWRLRFPCTLTRQPRWRPAGEETWFTDKMATGWWAGPWDSVTLKPGPTHCRSSSNQPRAEWPRLSAVYLSNDPSYRAPGFDPRVDFRK